MAPLSKFLTFSQHASDLKLEFFPPIELDKTKAYSLGLVYFITYNNIPNVDNRNNKFKFFHTKKPELTFDVSITTGQYEFNNLIKEMLTCTVVACKNFYHNKLRDLEDNFGKRKNTVQEYHKKGFGAGIPNKQAEDLKLIEDELKSEQKKVKDELIATVHDIYQIDISYNETTQHTVIRNCDAYQFDFNVQNSIGTLLGFKSRNSIIKDHVKVVSNPGRDYGEVEKKALVSAYPIRITNLNCLNIHCNLVSESYVNGKRSHLLYSIPFNFYTGHRIYEYPKDIIYMPIQADRISVMELRITDQNDNYINFQTEEVTLVLHLKEA